MEEKTKRRISGFEDLEVYQITYQASIDVLTKIVQRLPKEERFDLADQLRRSCKAIPRLIAEGFARRHQLKGFQKYLDEARGECNEMWVSLGHSKDVYYGYVDVNLCRSLIDIYDKASRQLYKLAIAWCNFHQRGYTPNATAAV